MTDNNHPIAPPPELIAKWTDNAHLSQPNMGAICHEVATQAARWGADQELDACCSWVSVYCPRLPNGAYPRDELYVARRPKPMSLKEQALKALKNIDDACESEGFSRSDDTNIIRRALESLPD